MTYRKLIYLVIFCSFVLSSCHLNTVNLIQKDTNVSLEDKAFLLFSLKNDKSISKVQTFSFIIKDSKGNNFFVDSQVKSIAHFLIPLAEGKFEISRVYGSLLKHPSRTDNNAKRSFRSNSSFSIQGYASRSAITDIGSLSLEVGEFSYGFPFRGQLEDDVSIDMTLVQNRSAEVISLPSRFRTLKWIPSVLQKDLSGKRKEKIPFQKKNIGVPFYDWDMSKDFLMNYFQENKISFSLVADKLILKKNTQTIILGFDEKNHQLSSFKVEDNLDSWETWLLEFSNLFPSELSSENKMVWLSVFSEISLSRNEKMVLLDIKPRA